MWIYFWSLIFLCYYFYFLEKVYSKFNNIMYLLFFKIRRNGISGAFKYFKKHQNLNTILVLNIYKIKSIKMFNL